MYKMFTQENLIAYSSVVRRVSQSPVLQGAAQALLDTPLWHTALLVQQVEFFCAGLPSSADALATALRHTRSAAIAALAQQDAAQAVSLETITSNMSVLADYALNAVLNATGHELAQRYGMPLDTQGKPLDLQVVAMGKHGGRELNVSSDIDLIFLARELEGDTAGAQVHGLKRQISNREFLNQWARTAVALLSKPTADGFVFRVDTLLRPHGSEGPMVTDHAQLENYLITQGRMWERLAWLKARGVPTPVFESAPDHLAGHAAWQAVVLPFVYRRYLDYTVIDALRDVHSKIREQRRAFELKAQQGVHVKLARGGIREIEFWLQGQQLIRAGRDTGLRANATLPALHALAVAGVIDPMQAQAMAHYYRLLRRAEHAVQYIADAQTHTMPIDLAQRTQVAWFMGFDSVQVLDLALASTMNAVANTFDELFVSVLPSTTAPTLSSPQGPEQGEQSADAHALRAPFLERVQALPIADSTRLLVARLIEHISADDASAFERVAQFILSISRRKTYIDLLLQHPPALARLQSLMHASAFAAQYLHTHPALIDELINAHTLYAPLSPAFWEQEKQRLLARLSGQDEESQLHALREAHHAWILKILAQDIAGQLDVRSVSDALSLAADIALDAALCCVHAKQCARFELPAGLAVIAYGKLGGKELGYGSDLDIVFVYDPLLAGVNASDYPRLVQRLISWLSVQTAAGRLFEIDTALRPNGQAGLMLTTMAAFADYQIGQSPGTHAWLWEHQAISRARLCAGDMRLTSAFDAVRDQVLALPREDRVLKHEIKAMRQRVAQGHSVPSELFDAKHSPGGMVDIEFAVQYLVLRHAGEHPVLRSNGGNVALLSTAAQLGLVDAALAKQVGNAYLALRSVQHRCQLAGLSHAGLDRAGDEAHQVHEWQTSVQALWAALGLAQ